MGNKCGIYLQEFLNFLPTLGWVYQSLNSKYINSWEVYQSGGSFQVSFQQQPWCWVWMYVFLGSDNSTKEKLHTYQLKKLLKQRHPPPFAPSKQNLLPKVRQEKKQQSSRSSALENSWGHCDPPYAGDWIVHMYPGNSSSVTQQIGKGDQLKLSLTLNLKGQGSWWLAINAFHLLMLYLP